ncbi:7TM-DISM domain-containing protein [Flavobacterium sp.]|uniref:7TM-DISM domain-containing protein n=1 Tax=Flavobacterium sp. TaxID=239 RepID=UPI003A8F21CB
MGKRFIFLLLGVLCSFSGCLNPIMAQDKAIYCDTLFVNGPNSEHLSKYLTFWVDSTKTPDITNAETALKNKEFIHWNPETTLNLGLNPHPLWLHLNVKSTVPDLKKYWWGFYTHADTITVYQKSAIGWISTDTLTYGLQLSKRKIKTRFSTAEIILKGYEHKELLVKIENYRHTQNAITDFTTPENNLFWETNFYWSIGFFIGCFLLISSISFFISIVLREKNFSRYGVYLILIIAMALMEELMVPSISNPFLFNILKRLHSLPIAIIALAIHYHIILYIIKPESTKRKLIKFLTRLNNVFLLYGIVYSVYYFIYMEKLNHGQWFYPFMWYTGIAVVIFVILITAVMMIVTMQQKKLLIPGLILAFVILYFNPAGYFLNYAGILSYYEVTYPNQFYWIVCTEFIGIGCVLAWRYKKTVQNHYQLLQEKALQDELALTREIEIQEQEREQIARDLHDDLGTTISAIKLIVTNSYLNDKTLVKMITKANNDLRYFFNKLTLPQQGLFDILRDKVDELNNIGTIQFVFITTGEEDIVPDALKLPIIRICFELLSNVLKHSQASEATLQLFADSSQVQIMMEDNGKGFDLKAKSNGIGINNIYARAKRWNAEIHISSGANGTTTIVTIPLN